MPEIFQVGYSFVHLSFKSSSEFNLMKQQGGPRTGNWHHWEKVKEIRWQNTSLPMKMKIPQGATQEKNLWNEGKLH